jgi:MYXO-CTERM domain-containing protein
VKALSSLLGLCILSAAPIARAHVVSFEPQEKLPQPWLGAPADDYSVASPRVLDNIWGSKSIFGYLDAGDADYFQLTLAAGDSRVLAAIPLTPACAETRQNYVNIAVYGPGLPAPDPAIELPFTVPDGMGTIVKLNPEAPAGQDRPIFDEPTTNTTAFLPLGATNTCIWTAPGTCDWSNSLAFTLPASGTYVIVVWAQNGQAQEYWLSVGFVDTGYYVKSADEALVYDNAYLHTPCTQLFPSDRFFDGGATSPADGGATSPVDGGEMPPVDAGAPAVTPDSGCGCALGAHGPRHSPWLLLGVLLLLGVRHRRSTVPPGTRE